MVNHYTQIIFFFTTCGHEISIKHILLESRQFDEEITKHNIPNILTECLNNKPLNIYNILKYINNTNLYKTI
jgi:hypothetical protein